MTKTQKSMQAEAYGDLGATIMAILLHPEARSQTSATNGALREPLIKAPDGWTCLNWFAPQRVQVL